MPSCTCSPKVISGVLILVICVILIAVLVPVYLKKANEETTTTTAAAVVTIGLDLEENKGPCVGTYANTSGYCYHFGSPACRDHKIVLRETMILGRNRITSGICNFCANPDKKAGPWCYTHRSELTWGFCFPQCGDRVEDGAPDIPPELVEEMNYRAPPEAEEMESSKNVSLDTAETTTPRIETTNADDSLISEILQSVDDG